jgi:hypothetical protein
MDDTILIILGLFKDTNGRFMKLVALHHDGDLGTGAPEDEYSAHGIAFHPGAGFKKTISKLDFSAVMEKYNPTLNNVVAKAFKEAPQVRDQKKIQSLLQIKRMTQQELMKAFEISTTDVEEELPIET